MLSQVNFKSKLPKKLQKYASFGVIPKLFLAPFAILTVLLFVLARPFIIIQVHKVKDWRLGHFATNTELTRLKTLQHNQTHNKKLLTVYYHGSIRSSNQFLTEIWKRELVSISGHWGWLMNSLTQRIPKFNSSGESTAVDLDGLLNKNFNVVSFDPREINSGDTFLKEYCGTGRFVCFNVRDSEFLKTRSRDMSYHNYRDSDIKTYVAAAEALAEMGYTVFRMGAIVKEPLLSNHPRVIDYATKGMRTEFLDIFLGTHCAFAVSTCSGWDSVPTIFRRPMMFVNQLPVFAPSINTLSLISHPKILLDCDSSEVLTLQQLVERGAATPLNTQAYKDAGVVIRDLSSDELVDAVTEMAQRVEGTFVETPEQKEMQAKLKHILSTHPKLQPSPNYYPIRAQFASCFLSRYPNFLK